MSIYFIQVTDCTTRSMSDGHPCVWSELIKLDSVPPGHEDHAIKQYVWNTYGLTHNHRKNCLHCDPRADCRNKKCTLSVDYYPIDIDNVKSVTLEEPPKVAFPPDWPRSDYPHAMFGEGMLSYR